MAIVIFQAFTLNYKEALHCIEKSDVFSVGIVFLQALLLLDIE